MSDFPAELVELLDSHIHVVPDFPEPGVLFRDITPLLADGPAFAALVDALADRYRGTIDAVAAARAATHSPPPRRAPPARTVARRPSPSARRGDDDHRLPRGAHRAPRLPRP